jgi:hypothetical protein
MSHIPRFKIFWLALFVKLRFLYIQALDANF